MDILLHPLAFSIVTLIFGVLILAVPKILNYVVGIYLLLIGILGLVNYFN